MTSSIMGSGCEIDGKVEHSVLFDNVDVEEGAEIKDSVILSGAKIHAGAKVEYSIVAEDVEISNNCHVGGSQEDGNLTVVARDITVPEGTTVQPGEIVTADKMKTK